MVYNTSDKLGIALACLAGVMAIALFLVEKTPATIVSLLLLMLALLVYPILHFAKRVAWRVVAFIGFGLVTLLFAWHVWPPKQADQSKATPKVSILGYEVILFKSNMNPFANVFFQNVGDKGQITICSSSGLSPTSADVAKVKKELESVTKGVASKGGGLVFSVEAQEKRWFTVMGPTLSDEQAKMPDGAAVLAS